MQCPAASGCVTAYTANGTSTCTPSYAVAGSSCSDNNLATHTDQCNATGACVGTPVHCPAPSGCVAAYTANGTSTCTPSYAGAGTACDDGNASTYNDQCNGNGGCVGTTVQCPAPSACITAYTVNGSSTCTPTYAATSTSCNDGNASTYNDHCNGAGTCVGTTVQCPATSACVPAYTQNGSSTCTPSYAATSTSCDDGNASTYNDHCNGAGTCAGTAVQCPATSACVTAYAANGTSSCTPTYAVAGTSCDDGVCSTSNDVCDGAGVCAGTVAATVGVSSRQSLSLRWPVAQGAAGYLVVRGTTAATTAPANGTTYTAGTSALGGTVVYAGSPMTTLAPAASTTIASGSDGVSLSTFAPAGNVTTLNVVNYDALPSSVVLRVTTTTGVQTVTCTGKMTYSIAFKPCTVSGANLGTLKLGGLVETVTNLPLPATTIPVVSTAGFPNSGAILVTTSAGVQTVTCTGKTAGGFTGCSGGTGTLTNGGAVVPATSVAVTDSGLLMGTPYVYRLYSYDALRNYSTCPVQVSGTIPACTTAHKCYHFTGAGSSSTVWADSYNWEWSTNGSIWQSTGITSPGQNIGDADADVYIDKAVLYDQDMAGSTGGTRGMRNLIVSETGSILFYESSSRTLLVHGDLENRGFIGPRTGFPQGATMIHTLEVQGNFNNYGTVRTMWDGDGTGTGEYPQLLNINLGGTLPSLTSTDATFPGPGALLTGAAMSGESAVLTVNRAAGYKVTLNQNVTFVNAFASSNAAWPENLVLTSGKLVIPAGFSLTLPTGVSETQSCTPTNTVGPVVFTGPTFLGCN